MKNKKLSATILASLVLSSNLALAASNYTSSPYVPNYAGNQYVQPLQGNVVMIPAGSDIAAVTTCELNSATLILGQSVSVTLPQDYFYNNTLVASAGSVVNGNVIMVKKASFGTRNGQLQIRFTNLMTPQGQVIPISGMIATADGTGVLKGGTAMDTTKAVIKDVAAGSAIGAVSGLVVSSLAGGPKGKSTAIATGVGAGAGLVKSGIDKGENVIIPANSRIDVVIDQPISLIPMKKY